MYALVLDAHMVTLGVQCGYRKHCDMHIRSPTAHLQQVYIPTHPMAPPELERALEADLSFSPEFSRFREAAKSGNLVPLYERVFSDQLTPVSAYRCLVRADDREAPSFLFESVINGTQQGRYSFVGAHPSLEIVAHANAVTVLDNEAGTTRSFEAPDPLQAREWVCCLNRGKEWWGGRESVWLRDGACLFVAVVLGMCSGLHSSILQNSMVVLAAGHSRPTSLHGHLCSPLSQPSFLSSPKAPPQPHSPP